MPRIFPFLALLLIPAFARADLKWTSTTAYATAAPSEIFATTQFQFTNTGNFPIKITATHTSCGCTAALNDGRNVDPGKSGTIDISFKTLNRRGLYEEPIKIDTNDPTAKETTLTLRVMIRNPVELLPTLLFWQPGEALTPKVIRITAGDGVTIKNLTPTSSDSSVTIQLEPVKAGADYKLTVTPKSQHVKATISIAPETDGKPLHPLTAHIRVG